MKNNKKKTFIERSHACKNVDDLKALFEEYRMIIDEDELQILFQRIVMSDYIKLGDFDETQLANILKDKKAS
ncbi:MAG: hypothetical protein Q4C49_14465 [Bacillota bacterium]|nr:hypothetical protein [Bacillota bacterium]